MVLSLFVKLVAEVLEVVTLCKNEDYYNKGKGVSNQIQGNILKIYGGLGK